MSSPESKKEMNLKNAIDESSFYNLFPNCFDIETLPSTHKQDWYTAKKTLSSGFIKPMPCSVFEGENLAYYFYGKAPYAIAQHMGMRGDKMYYPVCYVLDTSKIKMSHVFAFDTGAFAKGFFDDFLHKKMSIGSFAIEPKIPQLKGFVKEFFEDNDNYYRSIPKCIAEKYTDNDEVMAYVNMICNKGQVQFDVRCATLEIISESELQLEKSLKAIILAKEQAHSNENIMKLKEKGIEIITYNTFGGDPGSYNAIIQDLLYTYLLDNKLCVEKVTI